MRVAGFFTLLLFVPALAHAALININTADAALLDTLPGIGPAYATRIIDYRTVHGPFARIEDIQDVSGIGPSTFADIKSFITVGDMSAPSSAAASSTPTTAASGGASAYVPPPASLLIEVNGDAAASLGVPLHLSARVTTKGGAVDSAAQISWSFGDGSSGTGSAVDKVYRYAGTYLVTVTAVDGQTQVRGELVVTVRPAKVRLLPVTGDGITIANDSGDRLDLSGWRLMSDIGSFRIPDSTIILPESSVLFPFTITNLPFAFDIILLYPDGTLATRTALPMSPVETVAQLSESIPGSTIVQTVEPAISTSASGTAHENTTVGAPAAVTELAAAGAALPVEEAPSRIPGFLKSPWTLSFLGLMTLAGGAFILL
jgi:competence protein ComEA